MKVLLGEAIKECYTQPLDRRRITLVCNWKAWLDAQPAPDNHAAASAGMRSLDSSWPGAWKTTVHYIYYLLIILFTTHFPQGVPWSCQTGCCRITECSSCTVEAPTVSTHLGHSRICTGKLLVFTYNYQNGLGSACLRDTSLPRWSDCHSGTQRMHSSTCLANLRKSRTCLQWFLLKRASSFEIFSLRLNRKVKSGISWLLQVPHKI